MREEGENEECGKKREGLCFRKGKINDLGRI